MDTMHTTALARNIESLLFYKGEAMKVGDIARILSAPEEAVGHALSELRGALAGRGIRLITEGDYASLATAPESAGIIESVRKDELEGPLGKAGLETLAIVIYHGPISKTDIEYVRSVNSSSILRSLLMRGLVEKINNPNDKRSFLYRPTPELPAALGISSTSEAPNFDEVRAQIQHVLENTPELGELAGEMQP